MCVHLHVLVVLHCLVFGASCSVFFFFLRVCRASYSVWSSLLFLSPHCAVMWYSWVGPFVCGVFQVFSGPPCDLHPIASSIIWGFSGSHNGFIGSIKFTSKQDHGHSGPCTSTFFTDFRLNALCRQPCASVLSVVSNSAMVAASSLASTSGTLRLPPFVSMFTTTFTINSSCLDGLAQLITAPIMVSHASSLFLAATVWPHCATRHL